MTQEEQLYFARSSVQGHCSILRIIKNDLQNPLGSVTHEDLVKALASVIDGLNNICKEYLTERDDR